MTKPSKWYALLRTSLFPASVSAYAGIETPIWSVDLGPTTALTLLDAQAQTISQWSASVSAWESSMPVLCTARMTGGDPVTFPISHNRRASKALRPVIVTAILRNPWFTAVAYPFG